MPVIVLAGEEEFTLNKRLLQLKAKLISPAWQSVNFIKLTKPSLAVLREAADTIPFAQGNRIVLIENCDFFTKKRTKPQEADSEKSETADSKNNKTTKSNIVDEDLESILTSIAANIYLIFACPYNFDSTLKLSKTSG